MSRDLSADLAPMTLWNRRQTLSAARARGRHSPAFLSCNLPTVSDGFSPKRDRDCPTFARGMVLIALDGIVRESFLRPRISCYLDSSAATRIASGPRTAMFDVVKTRGGFPPASLRLRGIEHDRFGKSSKVTETLIGIRHGRSICLHGWVLMQSLHAVGRNHLLLAAHASHRG